MMHGRKKPQIAFLICNDLQVFANRIEGYNET